MNSPYFVMKCRPKKVGVRLPAALNEKPGSLANRCRMVKQGRRDLSRQGGRVALAQQAGVLDLLSGKKVDRFCMEQKKINL